MREWWTIPNLISMSRIPLAGVIIATFDHPVRYVLFAIAAAMDGLDGFIARATKTTSRLGEIVDPICDKIFAGSIFLYAFFQGDFDMGTVVIFFLRDIFTLVTGIVIWIAGWRKRVRLKARISGKVVTVVQIAFLACVIIRRPEPLAILTVILLACSLWSVIDYGYTGWKQFRQ